MSASHRDGRPAAATLLVEYWRWRYRDPVAGQICRTLFQVTEEEMARYPDAERIEGTMLMREVDAPVAPRSAVRPQRESAR